MPRTKRIRIDKIERKGGNISAAEVIVLDQEQPDNPDNVTITGDTEPRRVELDGG